MGDDIFTLDGHHRGQRGGAVLICIIVFIHHHQIFRFFRDSFQFSHF